MLFSFQRLMQTFRITTAFHNTTREFIDNFNFAIGYHVVNITMEQELSTKSLLQMIRQLTSWIGVQIFNSQLEFNLFKTNFGCIDSLFRFIHLEIDIALKRRHDSSKLLINICCLRTRTRNNERGSRFVDKDGVDLVYNRKGMAALYAFACARNHVIAQIVEAEF